MKIKIEQFDSKFKQLITSALDKTADVILDNVKEETPVDSGTLQNSIIKETNDDNSIIIKVDENSPAKDYAPYVNYGTSSQQGAYFVEQGYIKSKAIETFTKKMKDKL